MKKEIFLKKKWQILLFTLLLAWVQVACEEGPGRRSFQPLAPQSNNNSSDNDSSNHDSNPDSNALPLASLEQARAIEEAADLNHSIGQARWDRELHNANNPINHVGHAHPLENPGEINLNDHGPAGVEVGDFQRGSLPDAAVIPEEHAGENNAN